MKATYVVSYMHRYEAHVKTCLARKLWLLGIQFVFLSIVDTTEVALPEDWYDTVNIQFQLLLFGFMTGFLLCLISHKVLKSITLQCTCVKRDTK